MQKEIIASIPEISLIEDTSLRNKVVAVWEEALVTGGYTLDELKKVPFTLLSDHVSVTFLEHVRAVCQMCVAMAGVVSGSYGKRIPINRDILVAGALLADIGKMIEFEKRPDGTYRKGHRGEMLRHPFTGVAIAFKHEIPYEVMHIIAVHSKEGDFVRRSPEAILYHHAEFADFELAR
ncbi:MAG TPA: HDIG domain-containing protein [Candidatus Krumholzibacteria bacterium]|nr:HDIG domain-containing protein [Candidatus Krumholzibacteria bacterium]